MSLTLTAHIVLATSADTAALKAISEQTFTETYGHANTRENMQHYLQANFSEAALAKQLAEPGTQFYLLSISERTIGYLKLNSGTAQTELKHSNALEIERIYVLAEFQAQGFGKLLLNKALALAAHMRLGHIWLGVWEQNTTAIGFYVRMGFVEFDRHIFTLGDDAQQDLMMKLEINS